VKHEAILPLYEKLKQVKFDSDVEVTIGLTTTPVHHVDGTVVNVGTRKVFGDPYESFVKEIQMDLDILKAKHPEYTKYFLSLMCGERCHDQYNTDCQPQELWLIRYSKLTKKSNATTL